MDVERSTEGAVEVYGTKGDHSELTNEKGTFNFVTIGLTYSPIGMNPTTGDKIPQWGLALFFDFQYIPMRFKDPIDDGKGGKYRPEMKFWEKQDAIDWIKDRAGKFRFRFDPAHFGGATIPDAPIDPISQAFEYAKDAGLRINNLFQLSDGTWRANARVDFYANFAEADTAAGAVERVVREASAELRTKYYRERMK